MEGKCLVGGAGGLRGVGGEIVVAGGTGRGAADGELPALVGDGGRGKEGRGAFVPDAYAELKNKLKLIMFFKKMMLLKKEKNLLELGKQFYVLKMSLMKTF